MRGSSGTSRLLDRATVSLPSAIPPVITPLIVHVCGDDLSESIPPDRERTLRSIGQCKPPDGFVSYNL